MEVVAVRFEWKSQGCLRCLVVLVWTILPVALLAAQQQEEGHRGTTPTAQGPPRPPPETTAPIMVQEPFTSFQIVRGKITYSSHSIFPKFSTISHLNDSTQTSPPL